MSRSPRFPHLARSFGLGLLLATLVATATLVDAQVPFIRGDCRVDGQVDMTDVAWIIQLAFWDGALPPCMEACNVDDDDSTGYIEDAITLLQYLFSGGPPPAAPFPACGPDPTLGGFWECTAYDCGAGPPPLDPDYIMRVGDTIAGAGVIVEVPIFLDIAPTATAPVSGGSIGITHDSALLGATEVIAGVDLLGFNGAPEPDVFMANPIGNGWTIGWLQSILYDWVHLEPGGTYEIARARYVPVGPIGSETTVSLISDLGTPPIPASLLTEYMISKEPVLEAGTVMIEPAFRRGDADGDGLFVGVGDAIYTLQFAFAGGAQPPCMDASDFDDDGVFNPLSEAIGMLSFAYMNGPPPPSPGIECGPDPTADALDCAQLPPCP